MEQFLQEQHIIIMLKLKEIDDYYNYQIIQMVEYIHFVTCTWIDDVGNMSTSGNFQSGGSATVSSLDSFGVITAREGIYIYADKYLTANGPINAHSGLNVYSGTTSLQNTIITYLDLISSNSLHGYINVDTGNNMLFNITNGAAYNFSFSDSNALALSLTNATFNNIVPCPTLNVTSSTNLHNTTFTGTVNGLTKAMVALSNVKNTTDLLKPISTATQTA